MEKNRGLLASATLIAFLAFCACSHTPVDAAADHLSGLGLYSGFLAIYQGPLNHLAAVRRGDCPSYPSCSQYSRQAMEAHGAIIGWTMTVDRLLRCGRNETQLSPKIFIDGKWKVYDPLEANDQWWNTSKQNLSYLP